VPTNWEDDVAMLDPSWDWRAPQPPRAGDVFVFHPIHVAINSRTPRTYEELKSRLDGPLSAVGRDQVVRETGFGSGDFLDAILSSGQADAFRLIRDLAPTEANDA
jgi:hypothetical protein